MGTPDEWHNCITRRIFKKELKTWPQNYRGITVLNNVKEFFTSFLKDTLERCSKILKNNRLHKWTVNNRRSVHNKINKRKG